MGAYKPDKHGRDHCPGGEDPIPCWPGNVPWIRRTKGFNAALTVGGVFLDDEVTLGSGVGNGPDITEGSDDYLDYFSTPSNSQIQTEVHGIYEIYAVVLWDDLNGFDAPAWFYLHDGVGYPDAMVGHARPTGYGQLGSTTTGYWSIRCQANTNLQVDIAQLSGGDVDVDAWYIEVRYVGDYTGPERFASIYFDQ